MRRTGFFRSSRPSRHNQRRRRLTFDGVQYRNRCAESARGTCSMGRARHKETPVHHGTAGTGKTPLTAGPVPSNQALRATRVLAFQGECTTSGADGPPSSVKSDAEKDTGTRSPLIELLVTELAVS
jgi:hypothetical protein